MPAGNTYSYEVVLRRDGEVVGRRAVGTAAASEDALFRAVLVGRLRNGEQEPDVRVEPEWHGAGAPRVGALLVASGAGEPARYAPGIFLEEVRALARELLAAGTVSAQAEVRWSLEAVERVTRRSRGAVRKTRAAFPLVAGRLSGGEPGTLAVSVGERALEGLDIAMRANPTVEVAGLLTGRVVHDADNGVAELQVGDYRPLPAGNRGTSRVHFALDPTTFLAARRALRDLEGGETCVGWGHDHPPCENCPARSDCGAHTIFFSTDDYRVHQTAFAAPFQIGLVAGKSGDRPAWQPAFEVFGWAGGAIAALDFALASSAGARTRCAPLRGTGGAEPARAPLSVAGGASAAVADDEHRRRYESENTQVLVQILAEDD